jgi:formylglycine-generating enzyme required for sulfatase activity
MMFCLIIASGCNSIQNKMFYQRGDIQTYRGPVFGSDGLIKDIKLDLVWVEPGSFDMGPPAGDTNWPHHMEFKPTHRVNITQGYWVGKTQLTQEQWRSIMNFNPSRERVGNNFPVVNVSWNECVAFCERLTVREREAGRLPEGYVYRLPTEAEWEFAAKGGTKSKGYSFAGSDEIDEVAWYRENSDNKIHPVGQKKPNELGIYDMSGNLFEWCHDWLARYTPEEKTDPKGSESWKVKIMRGGGWLDFSNVVHVYVRVYCHPGSPSDQIGLRIALGSSIQ